MLLSKMIFRYRKLVCYSVGIGAALGVLHLADICQYQFFRKSYFIRTFCRSQHTVGKHHEFVNAKLYENQSVFSAPSHTAFLVHANTVSSNVPGEDRHSLAYDTQSDTALFAAIDGHKGFHCAETLKHNLLPFVAAYVRPGMKNSLQLVDPVRELKGSCQLSKGEYAGTHADYSEQGISKELREAFVQMDDSISDRALSDVQLIGKGHSLTEEMKQRILSALTGACVNLGYLLGQELFIANSGDCRAVIGTYVGGRWVATPLSVDQQVGDLEEVNRLHRDHPGEEDTVISGGRLLGSLMPLRSFGDVDFKWSKENVEIVSRVVSPFYKTPPYLTAEPVVTHRTLTKDDRFLVLATDGLWEKMSNEQVVNLVAAKFVDKSDTTSRWWKFGGKGSGDADDSNAATALIRQALGASDEAVYDILTIPHPMTRMYRDDITAMVIFFK